ncbi:hypothetical protein PODOV061v2_0066 [Vibrio phage 172P1]|nr:hypothetical protein PODOV061v2_0066 [Vibrio phage 172P1]
MWNYTIDGVEVSERLIGDGIYEYCLQKKVGELFYYDVFRKVDITESYMIRMVSDFNKQVSKILSEV